MSQRDENGNEGYKLPEEDLPFVRCYVFYLQYSHK